MIASLLIWVFVLSPLQNHPKLKQFHLHEEGMLNGYRYEIRCNVRCGRIVVPFSLVLLHQKQPVMIIQEELLGQIFLRSYTSFGVDVQVCASSLEEKISFSLEMARSSVQDPVTLLRKSQNGCWLSFLRERCIGFEVLWCG